MLERRPIKIRTVPQPPRVTGRPSIGRPMTPPEKRLDNLGQRFLKSNRSTSPSRIPKIRTGNLRNIYKPNPNIRNII